MAQGGGGGSQTAAGSAGESNRGYDVGEAGHAHDDACGCDACKEHDPASGGILQVTMMPSY
jgi:hypothetical protein